MGNLIYLIYGTAEAQPWDAPDYLLGNNIEEVPKTARNDKLKRVDDSFEAQCKI